MTLVYALLLAVILEAPGLGRSAVVLAAEDAEVPEELAGLAVELRDGTSARVRLGALWREARLERSGTDLLVDAGPYGALSLRLRGRLAPDGASLEVRVEVWRAGRFDYDTHARLEPPRPPRARASAPARPARGVEGRWRAVSGPLPESDGPIAQVFFERDSTTGRLGGQLSLESAATRVFSIERTAVFDKAIDIDPSDGTGPEKVVEFETRRGAPERYGFSGRLERGGSRLSGRLVRYRAAGTDYEAPLVLERVEDAEENEP